MICRILSCRACIQGCLKKRGKGNKACTQGIGLIANVTAVGILLAALLAGAAFWYYVVRCFTASGVLRLPMGVLLLLPPVVVARAR